VSLRPPLRTKKLEFFFSLERRRREIAPAAALGGVTTDSHSRRPKTENEHALNAWRFVGRERGTGLRLDATGAGGV
jgi:hypothetical protein